MTGGLEGAGDPDSKEIASIATGVPLGVTARFPRVPAIYLPKLSWRLDGQVDADVRPYFFPEDAKAMNNQSGVIPSAENSGIGQAQYFTHFPKDRCCDVCLRTTIPRASCRRRTGTVVPRADNFGDSIPADHKVLGKGCESRNNHRYVVVVEDFGYSINLLNAKPRLLRKQKRAYKSSWSRIGSLKSFTLTILGIWQSL